MDALLQLVSEDIKEEDREKLATLLMPYVGFDKNSKELRVKEAFQKIGNNYDKLELVFIAEKARSLLFEDGKNEGLAQSDIITLNIMPIGSVKSSLKKLYDTKKIRKTPQGKYFIPPYRLSELFTKYSLKGENNG